MEVPWQEIPAETLTFMIEEFVTRDGTDYGSTEVSLEQKVTQMKRLLEQDKAVIWFDETTETLSFFHRDEMKNMDSYY